MSDDFKKSMVIAQKLAECEEPVDPDNLICLLCWMPTAIWSKSDRIRHVDHEPDCPWRLAVELKELQNE